MQWDDWQIQVPVKPTPFPAHLPVRRVSVNTCGYGGTNAHIIVEEAGPWLPDAHTNYTFADSHGDANTPQTLAAAAPQHRKRPFLFPFSAADKSSLQRNIAAHASIFDKYSLHDLAYTLGTRRTRHTSRAFTVASLDTLADAFAHADSAFTLADRKQQRG